MSLRVLQIGADAAWHSAPQLGLRRFGVPVGGPFDLGSWTIACALAGIDAAVEIGPFGVRLMAESDCAVAVVGAERSLAVDGRPVSQGVITVPVGATLEVGMPSRGARSYLVGCGAAPPQADGLDTRPVRRGDLVPAERDREHPLAALPESLRPGAIRVVEGPDAAAFDLGELLSNEWRVAQLADRTGIRLEGPSLAASADDADRLSAPQVFGAIQISRGGTPIVIGPDGPTIGGYPVIAVVIGADRDRLGQVKPGDALRFELADLAEARNLLRAYHARLRSGFPLGGDRAPHADGDDDSEDHHGDVV